MFVDEIAEPTSFDLKTIAEQAPIVAAGAQSRLGDSLSSVIGNQGGAALQRSFFSRMGSIQVERPLVAAANQARAAGIPIFAVAAGQELALPDARLADLLMDEAVFLGDQVTLLATVSVTDVADANLTIRLRDHSSGEVLDKNQLS